MRPEPWSDIWERDLDDRGAPPDLEEHIRLTVAPVRGHDEADFREGGAVRRDKHPSDEEGD